MADSKTYCPTCGKKKKKGDKSAHDGFCNYCGAPLVVVNPPPPPPQHPPCPAPAPAAPPAAPAPASS